MTSRHQVTEAGGAWRAFAAGPEAWEDTRGAPPELDGVVRLVQRMALAVAVTWPLVTLASAGRPPDRRSVALLVALALAVAGLVVAVPSAALHQASRARPGAYLRLRLPLAGVALIAWTGLCVDAALLGLWPLGVAAGCDVCRTAWVLGLDVQPRRWFRKLLLSPAHLGVVVTLVAFGLVRGGAAGGRLAWLYATLVVVASTGVVTAGALDARRGSARRRWAEREEAVVRREHRTRGHWLHDDVCSDLRLLRLRLEGGTLDPAQVLAELDELDHRLRLRQLDEFIGSGEVRLAEVVQPFLRRAQQLRVRIVESPTVEDAGLVLDPATARAVQRALSVLVPNALQAGTPTLAVRLSAGPDHITVEVEDEAGGFDLDGAPAGRGLDGLRHELGAGALTAARTIGGSRVRAVVPRGGGEGDGAERHRHGRPRAGAVGEPAVGENEGACSCP